MRVRSLVPFEGLRSPTSLLNTDLSAGALHYCGLFVAGARPMWLVASRGTLVPHPMVAPTVGIP